MIIATVVLSILLAAALVLSATIKITRREPYVQGYLRVGVPENRLNLLAGILLAGAAGLVAGLWWAPLGIAAVAGTTCYFILGIAAHIRVGDLKSLPVPSALALLSAAILVLRIIGP